jgi:DNA-binding SARP family transcriptional activator
VNNRRDGYEIWGALSRFSPDVFDHPVWVTFVNSNKSVPDHILQDLQAQSQQLVSQGDIRGACQVLLICAALHKRRGKYEASLDCLQRAWELADSNTLPEIVEWAAWGSSGVHILLGQPDQAINSLKWLSSQLGNKGDWVLANLLELFALEIIDRAKGNKSVEIPLDWLLKWGEMPKSMNGTHPNGNSSTKPVIVRSIQAALSSFRLKLQAVGSGQLRQVEVTKQDRIVAPVKSMEKKPFVSQAEYLSGVQSPRINGAAHPPDREVSTVSHTQNSSGTLSIPAGNITESLPARAENGKMSLSVYCLGQFRVSLADQWISSWPSGKGKSILKFMVVNYPQPISKDVLMDNLWRDADPVAARNSLYVAIYGLRQAFKAVLPGFNPVLFEDDRYCLNPAMSVWLDVEEFLRLFQSGQELEQSGKLEETIQTYESAANLYQGDFLADDLYEEWPVLTRERLRITYLDTLDRLSRIYFNQGQYLACINLCHLTLTRDNCREDAHRRLMRCYSRQGQHQLALSQFQVCVDTLRSELGVEPEMVTMQLAERIKRRENV